MALFVLGAILIAVARADLSFVCDEPNATVVVVGAGAAGLTAAAALHANNCSVTVLEARDRIGGRMHTLGGAFDGIDVGAHWVHGGRDPTQPVRRWLDAHSIPTQRSPYYDGTMVNGTTGARVAHGDAVAQLLYAWDAAASDYCLGRRARNESDVPIGEAFGAARAANGSLAAALGALDAEGRALLEALLEATYASDDASDLRDSSCAVWWDATLFDRFEGGRDDAKDRVVVGGYRHFYDALAAGLDVRLSTPVARIALVDGGLALTTTDGTSLAASAVVFTGGLGVLRRALGGDDDVMAFEPPLPPRAADAIGRLGFGSMNQVVLQASRRVPFSHACPMGDIRKVQPGPKTGVGELDGETEGK